MKLVSNEDFAQLWNDIEKHPTIAEVGKAAGFNREWAKKRAYRLRKAYREGEKVPRLLDRSESAEARSLLPETQNTFHPNMTPDALIETLRGLYFRNPDRHITRIYFRKETGISDSTWNRYFGTFHEFRRQAGLEMNRHQHQVERQLAKHTAADHYRKFNERHDYGDRYTRDKRTGTRVIIGVSDLHDIECDPFYLRVFIETCRIVQPDVINFGGDIFDLAEFGKYGVDPREWDVVGRIKFVHKNILRPVREVCPNSQIDFVEGNHEFRLLRHLADATPALRSVLADLLGLTVPKLLGLDEFEINYIAKGDLAAYTKRDQQKEVAKSYVVYNETVMVHHHPHARQYGMPGWNGHHHHWLVFREKSALFGSYPWMQLGCGHQRRASYAEGEFWDMGFNICHLNIASKTVNFEYVMVNDTAVVGGLYFHRRPDEMPGN